MGISVGEINSAVRLWDKVMAEPPEAGDARDAPSSTAADAPRPAATSPALALAEGFPDSVYRAAERLSSACRPLYTQLFLPISQAPGGMRFLVDLRADLIALAAQQTNPAASAPLRTMADHLRQSLAEWFSVGLLHLQPISWEESSAALLDRVMRTEAVHPLAGWEELRRRLGPRRRVFAFTHPCMPGEPLVVLHTALLDRPAAAMEEILEDPSRCGPPPYSPPLSGMAVHAAAPDSLATATDVSHQAASGTRGATASAGAGTEPQSPSPLAQPPSTAVFYSISATQPGLHGIDLGQFLIKRASMLLLAEHPTIRQLVTLSPLPNFRAWLVSRLRQEQTLGAQQGRAAAAAAAGRPTAAAAGGNAALLQPREVADVMRLAQGMGWPGPTNGDGLSASGTPGGHAGAASTGSEGGGGGSPAQPNSATAAAALSWLMEDDRWLSACRVAPATAGGSGAAGGVGGALAGGGGGLSGSSSDVCGSRAGLGGALDAEGVLRPLLLRLAARYLLVEKRRWFALCPVAHFHLRNGASLWRLNWRADTSALGLQRSLGIMVNYQYDLPTVYDNNRRYLMQHEVHAHPQVLELLQRMGH